MYSIRVAPRIIYLTRGLCKEHPESKFNMFSELPQNLYWAKYSLGFELEKKMKIRVDYDGISNSVKKKIFEETC